jgi:hypothetical protein
MIEAGKKEDEKKNVPMKIRKETLNYDSKKRKISLHSLNNHTQLEIISKLGTIVILDG